MPVVLPCIQYAQYLQMYGAHSVPKPFNKLIYLANKINQFSVLIK